MTNVVSVSVDPAVHAVHVVQEVNKGKKAKKDVLEKEDVQDHVVI